MSTRYPRRDKGTLTYCQFVARFLMCPPRHYTVAYEINPYMDVDVRVDADRARDQWEGLRRTLEELGADVEVLEPEPDLPDLVFTANAGLIDGSVAVPSRFRHPQRQGEEAPVRRWFCSRGFTVREIPARSMFEGSGDAMPAGPAKVILAGHRFRSSRCSHAALAIALHRPVVSVRLIDARFYHLDLALLPLGSFRALAVGAAFHHRGAAAIWRHVPQVDELDLEEGLQFTANAVVIGDHLVLHRCPPRVGRLLERWGYEVIETPMDEFLKAGGSCRCLTLDLGTAVPTGFPTPAGRAQMAGGLGGSTKSAP